MSRRRGVEPKWALEQAAPHTFGQETARPHHRDPLGRGADGGRADGAGDMGRGVRERDVPHQRGGRGREATGLVAALRGRFAGLRRVAAGPWGLGRQQRPGGLGRQSHGGRRAARKHLHEADGVATPDPQRGGGMGMVGGGEQGSFSEGVGSRGVGGASKPPPQSGAELLQAPKALKKFFFGVNYLAPNAPEKIFDLPKARRKIWPNHLGGGGGVGGPGGGGGAEWCGQPPPPPQWC